MLPTVSVDRDTTALSSFSIDATADPFEINGSSTSLSSIDHVVEELSADDTLARTKINPSFVFTLLLASEAIDTTADEPAFTSTVTVVMAVRVSLKTLRENVCVPTDNVFAGTVMLDEEVNTDDASALSLDQA